MSPISVRTKTRATPDRINFALKGLHGGVRGYVNKLKAMKLNFKKDNVKVKKEIVSKELNDATKQKKVDKRKSLEDVITNMADKTSTDLGDLICEH